MNDEVDGKPLHCLVKHVYIVSSGLSTFNMSDCQESQHQVHEVRNTDSDREVEMNELVFVGNNFCKFHKRMKLGKAHRQYNLHKLHC